MFFPPIGEQIGVTLSNVEIDALIKKAVERELLKHGIERNQNNLRAEVALSNSRVINQLIDDNGPSDVYSNRATHFIVNNGNNDQNWSREHNYPDPAALAKQTQPGPDTVNCHTIKFLGENCNDNHSTDLKN